MPAEENRPVSHPFTKDLIPKNLVLYNDDVNTFDFVIQSLIEICNHEPIQAEQCALIAHYTGKCAVKSGDYDEIKPLFEEMTVRGLTVTIE
ncbi:MAG: ATP-dependent Clp protease adaptor ClpS [Bacteroidales bacterium]|nr:ATP-dependent Clp protease adaptor ClpS [Bacteroidales bacterium]HNW73923.1 ATP-dependent Clp protease adaptor ClpS [Bacteroidales bacterium]